jgi:hypothetical protein
MSAWRAYGGSWMQFHSFLLSVLDVGDWWDLSPAAVSQKDSLLTTKPKTWWAKVSVRAFLNESYPFYKSGAWGSVVVKALRY